MEIEDEGIKSGVLKTVVVAAKTTTTTISGEAVFETVDSNDQDGGASTGVPGVDNRRRSSSIRGSAKSHQISSVAKRPVGFFPHPYNAQCFSPTKMLGGGGGGGHSSRNNRRRSLPTTPMSASLPSLGSRSTTGGGGGEDWNQQAKHNRRMRRHQKKMDKRLRRLVQMAPNNNNEFLMQEHDPLYHLDDDDSNSDEQNCGDGQGQHRARRAHRYSSSPEEDEEDFLARDFSEAYDVVHAERLFNMSKNELIQEYQLMEERVEFLENKLRSALLERQGREEATCDADDAEMVQDEGSRNTSPRSESIPVPNSSSPHYYYDRHLHDSGLSGSLSDSDILISSSTGSSCSSSANTCTASSTELSSRRNSAPDDDDEVEDL